MEIEEIIENLSIIRNKLFSQKYETVGSLTINNAIEIIRDFQKIQEICRKEV